MIRPATGSMPARYDRHRPPMTRPDPIPPPRFPALRALEAHRTEHAGRRGLALLDPIGLVAGAVFVPEGLVPILARLDGTRSVVAIEREMRAAGSHLPRGFLADLVRQLDEGLLLQGELFEATAEQTALAFLAEPARRCALAGSRGFPADPDACARALDAMLGELPMPTDAPPPRGLIAPHVDLERGAGGYRAAYRALAARELPQLVVVLGTGHGGPSAPLTGLALDWDTPLGTLRTDRAVIDRVHAELGAARPADVLLHRTEHSLEFQMLMLAHVARGRDLRVAGFLCGPLPSGDGDPDGEQYVRELCASIEAAVEASGARTTFLAGADLAHVGPQFGDAAPLGRAALDALAARDRARLSALEHAAAGSFHRQVMQGDNPDRVCSATAIYLAARLAGGAAELLHYGQAVADDSSQCVSFCSAVFDGPISRSPNSVTAPAAPTRG